MIYFIADTHFGHANVIKMCNRPYSDIDTMNVELIAAWNHRVTGNDTVYILGDMFFRCNDPEPILKQLKGKKHLILGNHDGSWMTKGDFSHYFASINNYLEVSDGTRGMTLCHYPLLSWKHAKTTYMIHGHIHANTDMDFWPLLKIRDHVLNAGVDVNGYQPVTFDELLANNIAFKANH